MPFGHDALKGGSNLDFIYRSLIGRPIAPGRDLGVMAHGRLKKRLTYQAGLFQSVPALRRLYLETLGSTARLLTDNAGGDSPGWLQREVDRLAALVAPAVATDTVAPFTFPEFEGNVRALRGFLRTRPLYVDGAARTALDSSAPQSCRLPVFVEIPQQTGLAR